MNKSDKYYLKCGRLELSMLEDEDDVAELVQDSNKNGLLNKLEYKQTKQDEKRQEQQVAEIQTELKVSEDVYNTLRTMGKFLTGQEEMSATSESKQENKMSNEHHQKQDQAEALRAHVMKKKNASQDEEIISAQDLRLLKALEADETPVYIKRKATSVNEEDDFKKGDIDKTDLVQPEQNPIELDLAGNDKSKQESQKIEEIVPLEKYKPVAKYNRLDMVVCEDMLEQENIDSIVESFFDESQAHTLMDMQIKDLKAHIEKKIKAIHNGK
ncbi:MAG: hypothetical protein J6F30_04305 [Cellulosilyticum sp.]|nr:hypothetical protein [Cellulosilyticum sp.]